MTNPAAPRYHAFDGLRAAMMLLGIVLHASVSYVVTVLPDNAWGYKDASTSMAADFLVFGIHIFRMPVFFVMAGFFAALLMERYGTTGMLRNRAARVLVPFLLFWVLLSPLIVLGALFANGQAANGDGLGMIRETAGTTAPLWRDSTLHLWFLYFLVMFYGLAAVLRWLTASLPGGWWHFLSTAFRRLMAWRLRVLPLAIPTALVLIPQGGSLLTPNSFAPEVISLVGYLTFFGFGWALYRHRDLLPTLGRDAWPLVLVGGLLIPVTVVVQGQAGLEAPIGPVLVSSMVSAVCVWALIFGISGLFLRYLDRPSRRIRYLTDAAYWLYLIHLPLMFWVPGLLAPFAWPALLKIVVVLLTVTPIILATYHYLVRATAIGAMLNGRRYPRGLPTVA